MLRQGACGVEEANLLLSRMEAFGRLQRDAAALGPAGVKIAGECNHQQTLVRRKLNRRAAQDDTGALDRAALAAMHRERARRNRQRQAVKQQREDLKRERERRRKTKKRVWGQKAPGAAFGLPPGGAAQIADGRVGRWVLKPPFSAKDCAGKAPFAAGNNPVSIERGVRNRARALDVLRACFKEDPLAGPKFADVAAAWHPLCAWYAQGGLASPGGPAHVRATTRLTGPPFFHELEGLMKGTPEKFQQWCVKHHRLMKDTGGVFPATSPAETGAAP